MNGKLKAYLELSRLSNVPTVWSNVLVGAAIATGDMPLSLSTTLITMLAISFFYAGGMAQNDLFDLDIDTQERPERPLPSKRISRNEARLFITLCFALGGLLIALGNKDALPSALALLVCITVYNHRHKKWAFSLLFMGLCRALVYLCAAAVVQPSIIDFFSIPLHLFAGLLAAYIIALTLVAQKEASGALGYRRWLALGIVVIPFFAHFGVEHSFTPALIITGIALPLWLLRSAICIWNTPPKVFPAVLGWLSGICLVDAYFLALLDRPMLSGLAGGCFVLTVLGHKRILGT